MLFLLIALVPVALAMPRQEAALFSRSTCTVDTFRNVSSFVLKEYQVETVVSTAPGGPAGGSTQKRATLAVENPGTGDTYRLYHMPVSVSGGVWSICRPSNEAPLPQQLLACQYLIERRTHRIGFRLGWRCDSNTDAKQSAVFDATVIGVLPDEVCVALDGTDGVTESCSLPVEPGDIMLEVANIDWTMG
ncbi:hypothetical protein GE09DRAFT_1132571 [Coniochaeta sp. 2T2.1]|nr:hypothetical protein GE09DRAFT_1132571 [Coniochaeta sp. 2T2.1]